MKISLNKLFLYMVLGAVVVASTALSGAAARTLLAAATGAVGVAAGVGVEVVAEKNLQIKSDSVGCSEFNDKNCPVNPEPVKDSSSSQAGQSSGSTPQPSSSAGQSFGSTPQPSSGGSPAPASSPLTSKTGQSSSALISATGQSSLATVASASATATAASATATATAASATASLTGQSSSAPTSFISNPAQTSPLTSETDQSSSALTSETGQSSSATVASASATAAASSASATATATAAASAAASASGEVTITNKDPVQLNILENPEPGICNLKNESGKLSFTLAFMEAMANINNKSSVDPLSTNFSLSFTDNQNNVTRFDYDSFAKFREGIISPDQSFLDSQEGRKYRLQLSDKIVFEFDSFEALQVNIGKAFEIFCNATGYTYIESTSPYDVLLQQQSNQTAKIAIGSGQPTSGTSSGTVSATGLSSGAANSTPGNAQTSSSYFTTTPALPQLRIGANPDINICAYDGQRLSFTQAFFQYLYNDSNATGANNTFTLKEKSNDGSIESIDSLSLTKLQQALNTKNATFSGQDYSGKSYEVILSDGKQYSFSSFKDLYDQVGNAYDKFCEYFTTTNPAQTSLAPNASSSALVPSTPKPQNYLFYQLSGPDLVDNTKNACVAFKSNQELFFTQALLDNISMTLFGNKTKSEESPHLTFKIKGNETKKINFNELLASPDATELSIANFNEDKSFKFGTIAEFKNYLANLVKLLCDAKEYASSTVKQAITTTISTIASSLGTTSKELTSSDFLKNSSTTPDQTTAVVNWFRNSTPPDSVITALGNSTPPNPLITALNLSPTPPPTNVSLAGIDPGMIKSGGDSFPLWATIFIPLVVAAACACGGTIAYSRYENNKRINGDRQVADDRKDETESDATLVLVSRDSPRSIRFHGSDFGGYSSIIDPKFANHSNLASPFAVVSDSRRGLPQVHLFPISADPNPFASLSTTQESRTRSGRRVTPPSPPSSEPRPENAAPATLTPPLSVGNNLIQP